jgi:hypothetical protein
MAVRRFRQFIDRVYPGRKGTLIHGVIQEAGHVAVTGGVIAGFGYLANRYRDKHVAGMPVDLASGVAGTVAGLLGARFARGKIAKLVPTIRALGHAGLYSWAHTVGSGMGAQHAGRLPASAAQASLATKKKSAVLGMAPAPSPGDWLSDKQLAALAHG